MILKKITKKFGVCDIHKHALDDKKKRRVSWNRQDKIWTCKDCERDVVLTAMAITNRKIEKNRKNKKK